MMILSIEEQKTYKICLNYQLTKIIINQNLLRVAIIITILDMKSKDIKY